jgi:hypothetical protein
MGQDKNPKKTARRQRQKQIFIDKARQKSKKDKKTATSETDLNKQGKTKIPKRQKDGNVRNRST